MSICREYVKSVEDSNSKRMSNLIKKIEKAGVLDELEEIFLIYNFPYKAYSNRLKAQK